MKWISENKPLPMRLACAWLLVRFVDKDAEVFFCAPEQMDAQIHSTHAIGFDMDGVEFSDHDSMTSFDRILLAYKFSNPALDELGKILYQSKKQGLQIILHNRGWHELADQAVVLSTVDPDFLQHGLNYFDALYSKIKADILSGKTVVRESVSKMLS